MGRTVLYYAESSGTSDGWKHRLEEQGYEVLRTSDAGQLLIFARAHSSVGIILEASMTQDSIEDLSGLVHRLRGEPATVAVPIVAMFAGIEAFRQITELAEAGLTGFYLRGMPETMLLHYLNSGEAAKALNDLGQADMSVQKLATETRKKIHDLSQPLAALQGRLQILQSKTDQDDPQKDKIELMVKLIFEISGHLRELQEFHRQYG